MARNLIGALVADRYRLDRLLGEGGYGAVYAATHLEMGTPLALKLLHAHHAESDDTATRFRREARNTARLRHPHCVTVFDFGRADVEGDDVFFIAMELLVGRTLGQALAVDGPMPFERVLHILMQTLMALEAAHALGLVHRDLKPDNIFLTRIGPELEHVKVLDFGIAKVLETDDSASVTASGTVIGTPAFMSPEQCRGGAIDARSDLYSLGCVAWNMWVGRPPFKRDNTLGYLLAHVQEAPPSLAESTPHALPHTIVAWVEKCIAKDPGDRFQSAMAARESLERARAIVAPVSSLSTGLGAALAPPRARFSRWMGVAALALIGALAAFVVAGARDDASTIAPVDVDLAVPSETSAEAPLVESVTTRTAEADIAPAHTSEIGLHVAALAATDTNVQDDAHDEPDVALAAPKLSPPSLDTFCAEVQALPERSARSLTNAWQRRAADTEQATGHPLAMTIDEQDPRRLLLRVCLSNAPDICATCEVTPSARSVSRPKPSVTVTSQPDVPTPRPNRPNSPRPETAKPPEFQRLGD